MTKEVLPGSYVLITYDVLSKEGDLIESTKVKERNEKGEEVEVDKPIVIKIGDPRKEVFFEEYLIGVKEGEEKEIEVPPEKAYGKRDPKKIRTVPLKTLKRQVNVRDLRPGAILYDRDGNYIGVVRYIGRDVVIDGNHPFAGQPVIVRFKVHKVINPTDPDDEKVQMILRKYLDDFADNLKITISEKDLKISLDLAQVPLRTYLNRFCIAKLIIAEEITRETKIDRVEFSEVFSLKLEETPTPPVPSIQPSEEVVAEEPEEVPKEKKEEKLSEETEKNE